MREKIVVLLVMLAALSGAAMMGKAIDDGRARIVHAQAPAPSPSPSPHYLAAFAPIRVVGSDRLRFVNPATIVKLDQRQEGVTTLSLANGEEVRAVGNLLDVAHTLRVSVWLEEEQPVLYIHPARPARDFATPIRVSRKEQ